jgi:hypothetical protein
VTEEEARTVEKVLGISPGRRQRVEGAGPWLVGPAKDLFDAAPFVSMPAMTRAVTEATDADLEAARRPAAAFFFVLPLAARMLGAMSGDTNRAGMEGYGHFDEHPDAAPLVVALSLRMIGAGTEWRRNVEAIVEALEPIRELAADARRILDMPWNEVERNLSGQPVAVQRQARRIIDAVLDEKLDQVPHRPA